MMNWLRKILDRIKRWRQRRLLRRIATMLGPVLSPPDRDWFSLDLTDEDEGADG